MQRRAKLRRAGRANRRLRRIRQNKESEEEWGLAGGQAAKEQKPKRGCTESVWASLAAESWRRLAALHRELASRCGGKPHFLSCRDAAKVFPGLCHQTAYNINLSLVHLGVIEVIRVGDARPSGKASRFRYLLPPLPNGRDQKQ